MKTVIKFCKFLNIWGIIVVVFSSGFLFSNIRDSIRLENYLQRQIEGYLSRVLPGNSYLVTVSVDAQLRRTQELKNETVNNYLKEENITPPSPPPVDTDNQPKEPTFEILPGLEKVFDLDSRERVYQQPRRVVVPNQQPARNFREEENNTSREYSYKDDLDIREVSVQVAFDDSLNPNLVQSVKNLIGSKMDITFGDRATVIFSTVDLDQVRQEKITPEQGIDKGDSLNSSQEELQPEQEEQLNGFQDNVVQEDSYNSSNRGFDYYLDKYNSLFYLLLSILIFVILLLLFIFFLWLFLRMFGKRDKKDENLERQQPPQTQASFEPATPITLGGAQESPTSFQERRPVSFQENVIRRPSYDDLDARGKEEKFLDQFLKEPLLSRKYFLSLPNDDKNELLAALVSNATKSVFRDIANDQSLGQDNIFGKDVDSEEVEKVRDNIFSKHIDGINQFNKIYAPQMQDVFSKLSFFTEDEIKTLFNSIGIESAAIIAKNVDSQKMVPYLNQLTEKKRKDFLRIFNDDREVTQSEIEEFKRGLKSKTDDLARNIFIRKADNKFIKRKLLESSTDKKKFLESIKNEDPDFYNEYRDYMIDFGKFLSDESTIFNRTIQSAENEDITFALIGIKNPEDRKRVLDSLPQIRREFISGYVTSRQNSATKDDIINAQNNILDIYRNYIV